MTERRTEPLPGPDAPSAEVLDELLRAFSADVTDRAKLEQIDLASPEVDELICRQSVERLILNLKLRMRQLF